MSNDKDEFTKGAQLVGAGCALLVLPGLLLMAGLLVLMLFALLFG